MRKLSHYEIVLEFFFSSGGIGLPLKPNFSCFFLLVIFLFLRLAASCHVIYGERIGLLSSSPSQESQRFIWAVERMLSTTPPLLYLPSRLLARIGAPLWTQHATAWDEIFSHGEGSRTQEARYDSPFLLSSYVV